MIDRQPTVAEIAARVGGVVEGDADRIITGVSTPEEAEAGDLIFIDSARRLTRACAAAAALVRGETTPAVDATLIRVADPAAAMATVIDYLFPPQRTVEGVSPAAVVSATARLGRDVGIGAMAYIGDEVEIGDRTEIHPLSTVGRGARLGSDCTVHSGVHIYPGTIVGDRVVLHSGVVLGADGFGYTLETIPDGASRGEPYRHRKIRQVGRVIVGDDVEIGANTAVDRATFTATRIGRGTKIDNLVTVGHNSVVGRHCVIVGQAGISGSTELGDYATVAGQAGLVGHLRIGAGAVIGAQSGVTKDVGAGKVVLGSPAVDARRAKKALALIASLPEFKRTLAAHERRLLQLERERS